MMTMRQLRWSLALLSALFVSACDMDLIDPNNPNESEAITTPAGLKQVGVGLQASFSNEFHWQIAVDGLVTDQVGTIQQAFEWVRIVDAGGQPVGNDVGASTNTWNAMYNVVNVANVLLTNVPLVTTLQPGTASGLTALAKLYKAMAFGNLLQIYQRIPLVVGLDNLQPQFATRAEGFAEVLKLLNEARQHLLTTPPSTEFNNEVVAAGFNLANTIDAMIARYSLISGDLNAALTAAQRVNLGILSEFRFSAADVNPVWNVMLNGGNSTRMLPEDRFRTQAQAGDRRPAFWATEAVIASPAVTPLDNFARYSASDHAFPAYLPDEMRLIQAEVLARQNNLDQALTLLNQVRTPCTSALNEPIACLPALTLADVPTQQAMLDAILRERQYELFLQGLGWSDLRRFGKPVKYQFMMVSVTECSRNPNAPIELCQTLTPVAN